MSKINVFRAINVNYNNNANRIEDETFAFDGDSTLLSLQNGGGKTVLVQMMMAPFVHKRHRDLGERPFRSYFTMNRPTFLLIEWKLDGGAGYVLTGMMVRKSQVNEEQENSEELEIVNFIYEYQEANNYDIHNFPVIEQEGRIKKLKGFQQCKQLFEEIRKEKGVRFQSFDMTQSNQQRQYFLRLMEYGINCDEWESIIKKINLKESGLSELFKEAKDEIGLVEKWFLPAIETKLNKGENRIKQFHVMLGRFIGQYKENEAKIEQKKKILFFQEDAKEVRVSAEESVLISQQLIEQREKLSYLRNCIVELHKVMVDKEEKAKEKLDEKNLELREVLYEEVSFRLYTLFDELDALLVNQNQIESEKKIVEQSRSRVQKQWEIMQCAKAHEGYQFEERELLQLENNLEVAKKNEAERLPERNDLGYSLRLAYEQQSLLIEQEIEETQQFILELQKEQKQLLDQAKQEDRERTDRNQESGALKVEINQYGKEETAFNKNYSVKLERNILGTYEEGTFEVILRDTENKQNKNDRELVADIQSKKQCEIEKESLNRQMQECSGEEQKLNLQQSYVNEKKDSYEKQMDDRRKYMRYLSIEEEKQYEKETICKQFADKVKELRQVYNRMDREIETAKEELHKLQNGVVLEIPEEFAQLLHDLDINYVLGMDYIKKNNLSKEQNKALLKRIPLLPYSILLGKRDVEKLAKSKMTFYTSYAIPILVREELDRYEEKGDSWLSQVGSVHFFLSFNNHLLDEKELAVLLQAKQMNIDTLEENLLKKIEEINFYENMYQELYAQEVTKETYVALQKELEQLELSIQNLAQKMIALREKISALNSYYSTIDERIRGEQYEQVRLKNMIDEIHKMKESYDRYLENRERLAFVEKRKLELENQNLKRQERTEEIQVSMDELQESRRDKNVQKNQVTDALNKYKGYQNGTLIKKDLVDLETRYIAITDKLDRDVRELEESIKKQRQRFEHAQIELIALSRKYYLEDSEYDKVKYDSFTVNALEKEREDLDAKINNLQSRWHDTDKLVAVKEEAIRTTKQDLITKFQTEEPKEKETIVDTQFKKREKLILGLIEEQKSLLENIKSHVQEYRAHISALAGYSELSYSKEYSLQEEIQGYHKMTLGDLTRDELEALYGTMMRMCSTLEGKEHKQQSILERKIEQLLRNEMYAEDFYHQPLTLLRELTSQPVDLLNQLLTTLQSYEMLLEKWKVDLSMVDREQKKVEEMLLAYTAEVHKNLEKIDRNSTINVKGRSIKMLRIQVPSWEDNREIYEQRMTAFVKELTQTGSQWIEQNKNLEELLGVRITPKHLYDGIVGVGSTVIKLYKIEANREYPITWTQVSKNSGGEGFLSAFVILASLLSFMRRDESDLFVDREDGKVILMDNPFAQTNASHLLIPLMEIAKKYNTQLICLTGLGGESIYNRFDNIYVLNLIESSLDHTVQYLKAEHVKENTKAYHMSSSRIQVDDGEQMELLF